MRKLFTLLILISMWISGMTQEKYKLPQLPVKASKAEQKEAQQAVTVSSSPESVFDIQEMGNNVIKTSSQKTGNAGISYSNIAPPKIKKAVNMPAPNPVNPLAPMQGGENIATAFTLSGTLPISSSGTTSGYLNDYNEDCPYTGSTAPDVVYKYTPASNVTVDIDLCGSAYDTKLFLYENSYTPGVPFACNDDFYDLGDPCGSFVSKLIGIELVGGNTYYIVIDGYSDTDFGNYALTISGTVPCVWGVDIVCPSGAVAESEVCGTDTNGGCNMDAGTETWVPVPSTGGTICGTTWASGGSRDTDWFEMVLTQASNVTLTANSDQLIVFGLIASTTLGAPTCATVTGVSPNALAGPCDEASLDLGVFSPGTYWFFVGMTVYDGFACDNHYYINFNVAPVACPPPTALLVSNTNTTSVKLNWSAGGTEGNWNVEVGLPGFTPNNGEYVFRTSVTSATATASPLVAGTLYEYYVQANCGSSTSIWSGPKSFRTHLFDCPGGSSAEAEACGGTSNNGCNNETPSFEPITPGQTKCGTAFYDGTNRDTDWYSFTLAASADVTLSALADFDVSIGFLASPCPQISFISSATASAVTTATLTTRLAAGTYYAFIAPQFTNAFLCGEGDRYQATLTTAAITDYCIPAPTSVDGIGITNVTFSTVNNTTVAETGNYGNYSAMVGAAQRTATVPVLITFQTGYTYDTKIWIDWNNDFDFSGVGEEVYSGTSLSTNPTTLAASFFVPVTAPLGNHRMRIGGVDVGPPTQCYSGSYGTFEDYTVNVTAAPACPAPSGVLVTNILTNQVNMNWTENGTATLWNVKFGAPGFDPITQGTLRANVTKPYTLTGLNPATTYDVRVQAVCGSTWSLPATFTTACVAVSLPYTENFDAVTPPAIPGCMSVTNNNADAYQWVTSTFDPYSGSNSMYMRWNSTIAMNDWFFTPAFDLVPGTYNVSFWYNGSGTTFPEKLEVKWGSTANAAGMTNGPIFTNTNITNDVYTEGTGVITVTTAGTYYVGWHGFSDADMYYLVVDDISIVAAAPPTKTLNLTNVRLEHLFVEGTGGLMNQAYNALAPEYSAPTADVVTVELHNATTYATILRTYTGVHLSQSGTASVTGIDLPDGNYRITIKHRNSIETTSKLAVDFTGATVTYSFGTVGSAYGDNLKLIDGFSCILGGDVDQNGSVELNDVTLIENGVTTFLKGYVAIDVDGNGSLDINDYTIWENNNNTFKKRVVPNP